MPEYFGVDIGRFVVRMCCRYTKSPLRVCDGAARTTERNGMMIQLLAVSYEQLCIYVQDLAYIRPACWSL